MSSRKARAGLTGVGTIAIGVTLAACTTPAPTEAPRPAETTDGADSPGDYADGTYEARGWYGGLPSHHDVTVAVEDGVVIDVDITTPAEDATSLGYQTRFAEALPGAVIGVPLDEIEVDRLAGSSGCSEGFMDAVAKIRDQARA